MVEGLRWNPIKSDHSSEYKILWSYLSLFRHNKKEIVLDIVIDMVLHSPGVSGLFNFRQRPLCVCVFFFSILLLNDEQYTEPLRTTGNPHELHSS